MWSNEISIDKKYTKEIGYILDRLQGMTDLSFAVEEAEDRIWIYLASACEDRDRIEGEVMDVLEVVYLSFFKLSFFCERLRVEKISHAMCALLCSIIHFDREFESSLVRRALSGCMDYNIDGVYHFRLRALTESWAELAEVAGRLVEDRMSDGDIYDIASFITGSDGGKNQLVVRGRALKNLTRHKNIEVVKLFDDDEYNLLSAIILEKPCEILIEDCKLSGPMCATLRKIARVIER